MKTCTDCGEQKGLNQFYRRKDVRYRDGYQSYCIECCKLRKKHWYEKTKFNPSVRFKNLKASSKSRSISLTLTLEEYSSLVKQPCHYCESSLEKHIGIGLDRKDNNLGYTPTNSLPCCTECNVGKGEYFSYEEWFVMVKALIKYRNQHGRGQQTRTAGPLRARSD